MKSRYIGLRRIGTLALVLAWIVLILGIIMGIASWLGLSAIQSALRSFDLNVNLGPLPILGLIPGLLWGFLGFLVYYAIGKTLHLLVDVDERTMQLGTSGAQPAAAEDAGAELSGELKRQAKLIAANLEATQDMQRQLAAIEVKMAGGQIAAPAAGAAAGAALAGAAQQAADSASDAGSSAAEAIAGAAEQTADAVDGATS